MDLLRKINRWVTKPMLMALAVLVLGCTVTYYRAKIEGMEVPDKAVVVVAARNIRPGDEIKGTDVRENEVYAPDVHKNSIGDMAEVIGKVSLNAIPEGRMILKQELTGRGDWYGEDEREIGIKFKNYTDAVAGDIRPGDVVDIVVSYSPELGDIPPVAVAEGVRLEKVFNDKNTSYCDYKDKGAFIPHHVLVRLSSEEEIRFDVESKKGSIYLRRYGNYVQVKDRPVKTGEDRVIIKGGSKDNGS